MTRFVAESLIHASPERVFAFHELPGALERLTPQWIHTRVIEPPLSLTVGSRSIVEIRIAPLLWIRTESIHTLYDPPLLFEDEQVSGPFRKWHHRHIIAPEGTDTRLTDDIEFVLPLGMPGRLVLGRLRRLFAYRHAVTKAWSEGRDPSVPETHR